MCRQMVAHGPTGWSSYQVPSTPSNRADLFADDLMAILRQMSHDTFSTPKNACIRAKTEPVKHGTPTCH